jgi:hypothetical protein
MCARRDFEDAAVASPGGQQRFGKEYIISAALHCDSRRLFSDTAAAFSVW